MKSIDIDQIKNNLMQWLEAISMNSNDTFTKYSISNGNLPDLVDRAYVQSEMDYAFSKICREGLNKNNILNALKKINNGCYGICENCEEEIPINRLKAIPDARNCLSCQKTLEEDNSVLTA
jgi:DnaK suppressor protein